MEHGNLREALAWAVAGGEVEVGLRLAAALGKFWEMSAYLVEGREQLSRVLEAPGAEAFASARAAALSNAAVLAYTEGDLEAARLLAQESVAAFRQSGERPGLALALFRLAIYSQAQGDAGAARACQQESLALAREVEDPWYLATSLLGAGEVARSQEDDAGAMQFYEEGLALARKLGDVNRIGQFLHNMGCVARHQGDERRAATLFFEGLLLTRQIEDKLGLACCIVGLAGAAARAGRPERAARLLGSAEAVRAAIGYSIEPADRPHYEAILTDVQTLLNEQAFVAAWAEGRMKTLEQTIAYALEELSDV